MQFSDTTNNLGIIQDITFKTQAGTSQYSLADRTRSINNWYMKVTSWIIEANGRWQWDDSNQTNQPIATTNLVEDQRDYQIISATPSTDKDWLIIERVEIQDSSGNKILLSSIDKRDIKTSIDQAYKTSGQPTFYDFDGASIKLYPATNYAKTNGMKVWFSRAPLLFASDDTTKKPGFASIFHEILSLGAQYDWEKSRGKGNPEQTMRDIMDIKTRLQKHYGNRDKSVINKLSRTKKNYK